MCPAYRNWNWPERFFVDGYETFIRRFLTMLSEATDLVRQQQYDAAIRIITDIEAQLQEAAFPVPELMRTEIHAIATFLDTRAGRNLQAVERVKEAISLYEALGMWIQAVRMHNTLGILLRRLGQYPDAIHTYSEALQALQIVPNHSDAEYLQKVTLHNLGVTYLLAGHYEEALRCFETADLPFLSQINAAVVLQTLGDYEQSVKMYLEAIDSLRRPTQYTLKLMEVAFSPIILEIEDYVPGGRDLLSSNQFVQLAIAYTNFAITLAEQGLYEKALPYFQRAVHVFETLGLWERCIDVYINSGACYIESDDLDGAVECYEQARKRLARLITPNPLRAAIIANDVGEIHRHQGEYEAALAQYAQALEMIAPVDVPELEWRLHFNVGMCYELLGNFVLAQDHYQQAVNILEYIRGHLRTEELKLAWGERTRHVYEYLIELLLERGEEEDKGTSALFYAERCRARTLLDLLAKGPIGTLENVVEEGIKAGVVEPEKLEADAGEVIQSLPQGTVVLEYFVTERATYVWVIRRGRIDGPVELPHGRQELLEEIIKTRKAMEDQTNSIVNRYLAELYDRLIHPLEGLLPESHEGEVHLVIIPSGPLWYLPFQALLWTDPGSWRSSYLIERYTISYAPSLTVLKYAWLNRGKARPELCLLGIADPDPKDPSIPRLPEAREEAKAAAKAFPCHELYFDKEATEDVVQSRSVSFRHLLISTHGFFNPWNPMFSYLLLSPTQRTDGRLHAYEVFGLKLGAEIVVLSACETLLPSLRKAKEEAKVIWGSEEGKPVELSPKVLEELTTGEEIVGLTRAFFSAGAASVVSTLWSVPSKATRELMVRFYEGLREGLDKASALREAQLAVLGNKGWEHPYFWAAFCLSGDWGVPLSLGK